MVRDGGGGGGFLGTTVGVAKDRASVYSSSSEDDGEESGVSGAESKGFGGMSRAFERTSSVAYTPSGCSDSNL